MTEAREWSENHSNLRLPQQFAKAVPCFIRFLEKFQVATSHIHHIEDQNDFIESKNQAAKNNKNVKPWKKHKKSKHGSEGSIFFKISFYKKTETQERRE